MPQDATTTHSYPSGSLLAVPEAWWPKRCSRRQLAGRHCQSIVLFLRHENRSVQQLGDTLDAKEALAKEVCCLPSLRDVDITGICLLSMSQPEHGSRMPTFCVQILLASKF